MKRILFLVVAMATLASCGGDKNNYYCQGDNNRTYTDANAEFDTLSYALGMNLGVSINVQQADFDLDNEVIIKALKQELGKKSADQDFIEANRKNMERFTNDRVRNYMMMRNMHRTDRPDTLKLPALYDDTEYTPAKVSEWMGYDMGNYVRTIMIPVNLHWVCKAIEDSKAIENRSQIDSVMQLSFAQMGGAMREYVNNEMPNFSLERSKEWLADVAMRDNVEMLTVGSDTMYYRIEIPGSELKATSTRDTVSFRYEAFTRRGSLIESTTQRAESVREQIATLKADTVMLADTRDKRVAALEEQLASVELPTVPLGQFRIPGAIEGMKLVGTGGKVTLWMPATLAYGKRGNRQTLPNEAIVMSIEIVDVKPVAGLAPGAASIEAIPAGNIKPARPDMVVTPVKDGNKPAKVVVAPQPAETK